MASVLQTFRDNALVRIDVNGGAHKNPDRTVAPKSHIHIYNNLYEKKDKFAYEINSKDFPDIYNVYSAYISFLDYNNVKELE